MRGEQEQRSHAAAIGIRIGLFSERLGRTQAQQRAAAWKARAERQDAENWHAWEADWYR